MTRPSQIESPSHTKISPPPEGEADALAELLGLRLAEGEIDGETLRLAEDETLEDGLTLGDTLGLAEGETLGDTDGETDADGDSDGEADRLADEDALDEGDPEAGLKDAIAADMRGLPAAADAAGFAAAALV